MSKYQVGEKNGQWKGGRTKTQHGYILIRVGKGYPGADVRGYIYEHRLIAEQKLGRRLLASEIVHHLDGNKQNNSPDNIEIVAGTNEHRFLHRRLESGKRKPGEENPIVACSCGCGQKFPKFDKSNRPRSFISGHNMIRRQAS